MFERAKYKEFAKKQLEGRWKVPVLMILFTTVITWLLESPLLISYISAITSGLDPVSIGVAISSSSSSTFANLLSILETLVTVILEMAMISVYIKMSHSPDPVTFGNFIEGFSSWLKAILIGLLQFLWLFLWSLLFIIPGIVKAYAYSQMYYIACEYPNVKVTKLMDISKTITKGHKWDLFVLDLSFIGWFFLTGLTFGILGLWVMPYYNMARVNAYHALMKDAIDKGLISKEDIQ